MQEACKVLIGHHDFSSFRASGCQVVSDPCIIALILISNLSFLIFVYSVPSFVEMRHLLVLFLILKVSARSMLAELKFTN